MATQKRRTPGRDVQTLGAQVSTRFYRAVVEKQKTLAGEWGVPSLSLMVMRAVAQAYDIPEDETR